MTWCANERRWLCLYLAVLPAPTFIHDGSLLVAGLLLAIIFSSSCRWRFLKRSLLTILAFNLSVSLGVVGVGFWRGAVDTDWLLVTNLRVLLMVYLTVWFISQVNLLAALAGWPLATIVVTLALGQIRSFERLLNDFRFAFESRNITRPRLIDRRREAGAQAIAMLDKAQAQSTEVALAMRSRGVFE